MTEFKVAVTRILLLLLLALLSACTTPPPSCHVREYRSDGGQLTFEISSTCAGDAVIEWTLDGAHERIEVDCGVPWYLGYDLERAEVFAQIIQPERWPEQQAVECTYRGGDL